MVSKRLGLFGGTFDPVHLGHLAAAEEAADQLRLDQVLFVPAHHQPLKDQAPHCAIGDRLSMLGLAVADNPRFAIDPRELERPAPSYTVDTLRLLRAEHGPDVEFLFLLGVDALEDLARWREPADMLRMARLVGMSRGGVREPDWSRLEAAGPDVRRRVDLLAVPGLDISSHDLRRRVAAGRSIRYQVPDAVRAYISEHRLYQA